MFLQVRWPSQQCQSTEGGWLVIQIALNLTRLMSPCYNNTRYMHIQDNENKEINLWQITQRNLSTVSEPSEMKQNLVDWYWETAWRLRVMVQSNTDIKSGKIFGQKLHKFGDKRYDLYLKTSQHHVYCKIMWYSYILVVNLLLAIGRRCRESRRSRHCSSSRSNSLARHLRKSICVERSVDKMSITLHVW